MKVKQINDIDGFFKALEKCTGRIELITEEGDVLNLSSVLTQFIGLTKVFNNPLIQQYDIVCEKEEDWQIIKNYLVPAGGVK